MEQKTCFFCKNTYNEDEMRKFATFNGFEFSCKECARSRLYKCSSCKISYYEYDFEKYHINDKIVCSFCEHEYFQCSRCHKEKPNTKMAGNLICSDCFNKDNNDNGKIHDYLFKPKPIFHKNKNEKTNLFIGIELEINPCIDNYDNINFVKDISNQNNFVYCKSDGSLSWDGVEIVSHPATLRYHIESNEWKNIFTLMQKYNMSNINGCGLHFHLSRKFFDEENLRVIDYFVNNNEELMQKIGGRRLTDYCERAFKSENQWGLKFCSDHCDAINLTPKHTIELRFCQSTNIYDVFVERLNYIYKIALFSKSCSFKDIIQGDNIKMFEHFCNTCR